MPDLFDHSLRALRRNRAARTGTETFLFDRAFEECVERLSDIQGDFQDILLAGCPNGEWPSRFAHSNVTAMDPGALLAMRAGGVSGDLEALPFAPQSFDLVVSIGLLDTANNLPLAAAALRHVLRPGGLLLGAIAGGESLPRLRRAMLATDRTSPHIHPRIEAASLAQLLASAGFSSPVVDVDRIEISYPSLDRLVRDLRAMGATNILRERARLPLSRQALAIARKSFLNGSERATEQFEILHFIGWKAQTQR